MADPLSIGISGLSVTQKALATAGNNITNANTPGYSRQRVNLAPQPQQYVGVGYIGSGVKVEGVQRIVDQFYVSQLQSDTATFNELDMSATQMSQLDSLLADESTGLSPSLQQLFSDMQQASQDPSSIPVRQVVLSDLGGLAQRFNALYGQLQSQSQSVNQRFDDLTSQVTSLAQNIAKLNQSIVDQGGSTGSPPNSLLDQRDDLLRQLSEVVGVKTVTQNDGMVNVFVGSGQPLVIGTRSNILTTAPSTTDPSQKTIQISAGGASQDITQYISGGKLGGLATFQRSTLNNSYNALGRIAISVADAMNQQQLRGVDLNGNTGTNLFTNINSASAMSARVLPSSNNTGTDQPALAIVDPSALTTSDYQLKFTSATAYTLTRLSDGVITNGTLAPAQTTIPATGSIDGFQVQVSATPTFAAGDTFAIQPTRLGALAIDVAVQTPQQLAFAQPIRTATNTANQGGGTISQGVMVPEYGAVTPGASFNVTNPLTQPILIRFTSATAYQILDNSNPAAPVPFATPLTGTITAGQNNVVQINDATGAPVYQLTIAGTPVSGDQFSVGLNNGGSSDNRNALAFSNLNLTKTIGSLSFSEAYGQMVSDVGATTAAVKNNRDAANTLLAQSQSNRDSVSGVNLDEEAANLIKFQQAYQASAQVITIARSLFTTLLGAFQ